MSDIDISRVEGVVNNITHNPSSDITTCNIDTINTDKQIILDSSTLSSEPVDDLVNFPAPTDDDFEDVIETDERRFYIEKLSELKLIRQARLHCTSCDKHLGLQTHHVRRYRMHPLLRTLVCITCQEFYCSGEFTKGEDGSELYCRWCGQGGQVFCCAKCPIVFCQKCIKRNFGTSKITEIESNDDWECFVCHPSKLWSHRARLWSLILYCNFKNQQAQNTTDVVQRANLLRICQTDESECCPKKVSSKPKTPVSEKKKVTIVEPKLPKPPKPPKVIPKKLPAPVAPPQMIITPLPFLPIAAGPPPKKTKFQQGQMGYTKVPAKKTQMHPIASTSTSNFNGYMPMSYATGQKDCYANAINNDSLNLSLDNLTQGLDMNMFNSMNQMGEEDMMCAPDLPLEPVCEVTEGEEAVPDSVLDDDVECLTPNAKITPKPIVAKDTISSLRPLLNANAFNNIIQMTENDVIVNKVTGGLKFKVDPSTLSSSKMYKLPDGRVFAINVNPKMPGGYSATIVSLNEESLNRGPIAKRGRPRLNPSSQFQAAKSKPTPSTIPPPKKLNAAGSQKGDGSLQWIKFNVCEAIELMEYVLKRLTKLQNTSGDLKNKQPSDVKEFHHNFEQLLKTSEKRFASVRTDFNSEFKSWLNSNNYSELISDDEDVQMLPTKIIPKPPLEPRTINSEPIEIDENSDVEEEKTDPMRIVEGSVVSLSTQNVPNDVEENKTEDGEITKENSEKDECSLEKTTENSEKVESSPEKNKDANESADCSLEKSTDECATENDDCSPEKTTDGCAPENDESNNEVVQNGDELVEKINDESFEDNKIEQHNDFESMLVDDDDVEMSNISKTIEDPISENGQDDNHHDIMENGTSERRDSLSNGKCISEIDELLENNPCT